MFDFSMSEIALSALVAFLVLKPEDLMPTIKNLYNYFLSSRIYGRQYLEYIKNEMRLEEKSAKYIKDMDGNDQQIYDVPKIIKKRKKKRGSNDETTE